MRYMNESLLHSRSHDSRAMQLYWLILLVAEREGDSTAYLTDYYPSLRLMDDHLR